MSELRCLKCGLKFDYIDEIDYRYPFKKELKEEDMTQEDIDSSDYEWVICEDCRKRNRK